jgi:tetratricopeptide (TPR) repeat protein
MISIARLTTTWVVLIAGPADLRQARELWLKGSYEEAIEAFDRLREVDAVELAVGKFRCLMSLGRYDAAAKLVAESLVKAPKQPRLLAAQADLHLLHGRYAQAISAAEEALKSDDKTLAARWIKVQALAALARHEVIAGELEWFIRHYNDAQPTDPDELLFIAQASAEYARRNRLADEFDFILNELLTDAGKADEHFWQANWYAGSLLLEKYNREEAIPELKQALAKNPNAVEALVALGEAMLAEYDFIDGNAFVDQALAVNGNHPGALRLKADLLLADGKTDQALAYLERAHEVNPASEETLARWAAYFHLKGQPHDAERFEQQVLKVNPRPGIFYFQLAERLEKRQRFDPAERYLLKAIEAAPHLAGPRNALGMLYMRIGKEDDARKVFAQARAIDPFHVRVLNMIKVLRHLEEYETIRTPHYEILVRRDQDGLLGRVAAWYLESQHDELCRRFGYHPPQRSRIEILVNHQWFSGRVVGLPRIDIVGACTGKVVAMVSPHGLPQPFNWARVLRHEVTHILTLQQTHFTIPHWFTEALAVRMEGYPRPQVWNELLAQRVPKGELFNLDTINMAFARPKSALDWQMAYCQSLLYAEYMIKRSGEKSLIDMLAAYRDGLETEQAIKKVFGVSVAEFEKGYREHLQAEVAKLRPSQTAAMRPFAQAERAWRTNPKDADAAAELAWHYYQRKSPVSAREQANAALALQPRHPLACVVLASMERDIGELAEAVAILEPALDRAHPHMRLLELLADLQVRQKNYAAAADLYSLGRRCDPLNQRWVEGIARVRLLEQDNEKLAEALAALAAIDADSVSARRKLAELAEKRSDWAAAERWAREVLFITAADASAHQTLAKALLERKQFDRALETLKPAVEFHPKNHELAVLLAEAYLGTGDKDQARTVLQQILAAVQDHPKARELLERLGPR